MNVDMSCILNQLNEQEICYSEETTNTSIQPEYFTAQTL